MPKILLVGSGRLARHLNYWNSLSITPSEIQIWSRRQNSLDELYTWGQKADIVWLAISDSSLVHFYEEHFSSFRKPIVHFSGALDDARLISAHPLMSFPTELMPPEVYGQIHFVVTGTDTLKKILPGFQNSFSLLKAQNKAFYHALCVMAGNFPQLLWSEIFPSFEKLHIPDRAVETYIKQITINFIELRNNSLTGPLVRKDQITIEKNLTSLTNSKLKTIYQNFVEVFTK